MARKKKFIDKKKSSTYHLLHRSQRDVSQELVQGDTQNNGMILWPSHSRNLESTDQKLLAANDTQNQLEMNQLRSKLDHLGLLDVDHEQYLKPISTHGTFLTRNGTTVQLVEGGSNNNNDNTTSFQAEDALLEVKNDLVDNIALNADCMDDDIAAALFGDDLDDFEELDDEFVMQAASDVPNSDNDTDAFDYEAHIRELLAKTQTVVESQDTYFDHLAPISEQTDDAVTNHVLPKLSPEEEKALCEKFEQTLLEYASTDEEEEEDDYEIRGTRDLETDQMLRTAIDSFGVEKEDDILMPGNPSKTRQRLQYQTEDVRPVHEILSEADATLSVPKAQPPPEDVLIDGKSYYTERERNPWDCESILSTYSNLDNNPVSIGTTTRRRRRRQSPNQHIRLSNKTGLPLPLPADEEDSDDDCSLPIPSSTVSVNRGVARNKAETVEQKRARKLLVKRERELARLQKKLTKQIYTEEFQKHAVAVDDVVAHKTVFRYS